MKTLSRSLAAACAAWLILAPPAAAQTTVADAWVRATVPQQKASGLFGTITAARGGRVVGVSSPLAGIAEVHEMSMAGDVMKMRAVPALELPAGKPVKLAPGGVHVMLMDLKRQLKAGETVPVTFVVEGAGGRRESVEVKAAVKAVAP